MNDNTFIYGVNYWPANHAMGWWKNFDKTEVEADFSRIKKANLNLVRIFLLWEDFQPSPSHIPIGMIDKLKYCADIALNQDLKIMPTFFCGHMSGINWMPAWMLSQHLPNSPRFPVCTGGRIGHYSIRNCFEDEDILEAQILQADKICRNLLNHPAIYAYDLGNESSNCFIPPDRFSACKWLYTLCSAIRGISNSPVTFGLHAEDLEEDRRLYISDVALYCDFISMHGYPFYLKWVTESLDYDLVPFLGLITLWLAEKPVMFQEFGAPTYPLKPLAEFENHIQGLPCPLFQEDEVYHYYRHCLEELASIGIFGAMAWCYGDYSPAIYNTVPLNICKHERYFGIFRYDNTPKQVVKAFNTNLDIAFQNTSLTDRNKWLKKFDRNTFYINPLDNLKEMFTYYKYGTDMMQ